MLNATKENGTIETIEELDKLRQTMKDQKGDVMEIGEERDMLMEQLKALQRSFIEKTTRAEKGSLTIQLLQKDLKLAESARKSAENSTCLHSDSFEINIGKPQGVNIDSSAPIP